MRKLAFTAFAIALAACVAHSPTVSPRRLGAIGPSIPFGSPSWGNGLTLALDPANVSGCAADTNDCSAACGSAGVGPCVHWYAFEQRWYGYAPVFTSNTTIKWLSSGSGMADPAVFLPFIENGAAIVLQGVLGASQQIATGVLSNVTAKNRATPQLLLAQSGATAINQLVVNTTHPSRAWTSSVSSGVIFNMTQPLVPATVPGTGTLAEVDTWANGDSVTVYAPPAADLVYLAPSFININGGFTNQTVYVYDLTVLQPNVGDAIRANHAVAFYESNVARYPDISADGAMQLSTRHWNSLFPNGISVHAAATTYALVGGSFGTSILNGVTLDGDIISTGFSSVSGFANGGILGLVYVANARSIGVTGAINSQNHPLFASNVVWGPGTLNVNGSGRVIYPTGATGAANCLLVANLTVNSQTKVCLGVPGAASAYGTCNITLSAANLDANLGATVGCMGFPNGGSFCNSGL